MSPEEFHVRLAMLEKGHENFEQAIGAIRDSQEEIAVAIGKIATSLDFAHQSYNLQSETNKRIFSELKLLNDKVSDLPSIREKVSWFTALCGLILVADVLAIVHLVIK